MTAVVPSGVPGRRRRLRPSAPRTTRSRLTLLRSSLLAVLLLALTLAGCSSSHASGKSGGTLTIGAIPDQDPQQLQRLYGSVADYLSTALGVKVVYKPVTDYTAAVSLFRTGDLQMVWFGGLTGVQARLQTPGAVPLVQRDIDEQFHSLFIANADAGLVPVTDVVDLAQLNGTRFTFGSQSSTSGYLMPAYFLTKAGVDPAHGFTGEPGFSGSHDKTIDLVTAGTYQAGVVNEQVWNTRLAQKRIDTTKVQVLFRSPPFHDYHWLLGPGAVKQFGSDFPQRVSKAFENLDASKPADQQVLSLFGAHRFVPTTADDYQQIEQVGRQLGLIQGK